MTDPQTAAGRALAARAKREAFGNWEGIAQFEIPAIEAEAAAPYRRLLREWQSRTMGQPGIADLYDRTSALLRQEVGP